MKLIGDSMVRAGMLHGDTVICRQLAPGEALQAGKAYALSYDGDLLVRRVYTREGRLELIAANPSYGALFVPVSDVDIIGRVTGIFRVTE